MEIQLFNNPQFGEIRTAGTPDDPRFCLADVCKALDLRQGDVRQRLSDGVVSTQPIVDSLGREQQANFVNEDGLYDVILDSRKPEARAFRKWITSEVIPQIRRTGGYIPVAEQDTEQEILAKAVLISQKTIEVQKQRIAMLEGQKAMLTQENQELAPKAEYTDEVLQSNTTYTHTQMAKELNFRSVNVFLAECVKAGILYKQSGMWLLYSKYGGHGYMKTRTTPYRKSNGEIATNSITVWTEEGRMFLHKRFNVALQPIDLSMFGDVTDSNLFAN